MSRSLATVTPKVLTATLLKLEADGPVWRRIADSVPPRVTFGLTERAQAPAPVFDALAARRLATPPPPAP